MDRFKALLITRDEATKAQSVGVDRTRPRRPDAGRRRRPRRIFDGQLQGRAGDHRQAAGGAAFPDDPGHRFRRHGDRLGACRHQAGRQGGAQRLGRRRGASRRLQPDGAGQGRLADPAARRPERRRGDGDRHGRLHGDAGAAGAGTARHDAGARAGGGDGRRRRRRLGRRRAARRARLHGPCGHRPAEQGGLPQGPRRQRDRRPRRTERRAEAARPRNAGRAASIPSAATFSPTSCR